MTSEPLPMAITAAQGFTAAGVASGVKESGDLDLALVATTSGRAVPAAAVFTANQMTAAPVNVSRSHLAASGARVAAVILNSGNANAGTGRDGEEHAERMCAAVAGELGCESSEVLVCSTGLIGIPLPVERIEKAVPSLVAARAAAPNGGGAAAEAIRTTDTVPKVAVARADGVVVSGMAKGAAMLAPNMATMLAVVVTDAATDATTLQRVLGHAVDRSFNRLSVDGACSTNDTVIALASGDAGPISEADLEGAVSRVCVDLALQMAGDAEGATKVVQVRVVGAASPVDAERVARGIADSQLVKCSWYGGDPYWGRVASEAGSAGAAFDQSRVAVRYGGVTVAAGGVSISHDEAAVAAHMEGEFLDVEIDLGLGSSRAEIITNDLTHGYIDENMVTS